MRMYRQGDLLIKEINEPISRRIILNRKKSPVILEGEITGHRHELTSLQNAEILEYIDNTYINVTGESVDLIHPEHDTITIPQGTYQVIRQREYDENEIRYVND